MFLALIVFYLVVVIIAIIYTIWAFKKGQKELS